MAKAVVVVVTTMAMVWPIAMVHQENSQMRQRYMLHYDHRSGNVLLITVLGRTDNLDNS